jgi:hypothetical protein
MQRKHPCQLGFSNKIEQKQARGKKEVALECKWRSRGGRSESTRTEFDPVQLHHLSFEDAQRHPECLRKDSIAFYPAKKLPLKK